jgi:hypothetical protein
MHQTGTGLMNGFVGLGFARSRGGTGYLIQRNYRKVSNRHCHAGERQKTRLCAPFGVCAEVAAVLWLCRLPAIPVRRATGYGARADVKDIVDGGMS